MEKLLMKLILLVAIALFAVGCTETPTTTNSPSPAAPAASTPAPAASADPMLAARANYAQHCVACHGPNGEGGPVKVDNKTIKVPSLRADHAIKHTDAELTKILTGGEEAMPAFKDKLTQDEITQLVSFVRTTFQKKS